MELMSAIDVRLDRFVSRSLRRDPDIFRQAKRVVAFDLALSFWVLAFAGIYWALGSAWCGLITLSALLPITVSLLTVRIGRSPALGGNLLCLGGFVTLTWLGTVTGGWTAIPPMLWYTVLPVVAVLTCGLSWGVAWTLISVGSVGLFASAHAYGITFRQELSPHSLSIFGFAAVAGLLLCQFLLAWVRVGIEQRALTALRAAKRDLAKAKAAAEEIKASFGISLSAWTRLNREKAALEYIVQRRFGKVAIDDALLDDSELDDADLDDADLDDMPIGGVRASDC